MKKVLLILNPSSGMGAAEVQLYHIISSFASNDCLVTVYPLLFEHGFSSRKALELAKDQYDIVVCFGGDGTLSHTINDYISMGLTVPLGYLPAGSTNDFAHSLGIPSDCIAGSKAIAHGKVFHYDVGCFNDSYFNYIAAFGAFTKVTYETNQAFKNVLGYAAYVVSALFSVAESMNIRCPITLEHDGKREEMSLIFGAVSNSTSVAGFKVPFERDVKMDDGLFEVILIKAPENFGDLTQIIGCLAIGSLDNPFIQVFQTSELHIIPHEHIAWTLDGEYGGTPEDILISNLKQCIPILIPDAGE